MFLHGFMGSGEDFAEIIERLLSQFCCLLVDLPGHGKTKIEQNADYQMSNTAKILIALLETLDIRSCFLVGYSMGGRIALYLAIYYPQYFKKVVLESASPGLKTKAERELRIEQDLLLIEKLKTQDFSLFLKQWYDNRLFKSFTQHPNYQQAIAKRLSNNPTNLIKSLKYMGLGVQPSLWNYLSSSQVPLLLLAGELDPKFLAINLEIANLNSQFSLKIVENSGHNIHFEQPQLYSTLVSNYLSPL